MLQELKQDIEQSAPEKRTKLLRFVSETCAKNSNILPQEQLVVLATIAEHLFDRVNRKTLIEAASAFSTLDFAPHPLILKFANDKIDVAVDVLEHSTVLHDQDLIDVIQNQGDDHRQSIALRASLTSLVTDCLISHSNLFTLMTAVRNRGASFSIEGFKELATIGTSNPSFGEVLSIRGDMPEEIAEPLLKNLEANGSGTIGNDIRQSGIKFDQQARKAHVLRRERSLFLPRSKDYLDLIGKGSTSMDECVLQLCKTGSMKELCQIIAARAQMSVTIVSSTMTKIGGNQFIELCQNLGLSRSAFEALALLRVDQVGLPKKQVEYLLRQYDARSSIATTPIAIAI